MRESCLESLVRAVDGLVEQSPSLEMARLQMRELWREMIIPAKKISAKKIPAKKIPAKNRTERVCSIS